MRLNGTSGLYSSTAFSSAAAVEYSSERVQNLLWLAGGEVELQLFSLQIQQNLGHVYYNRFFGSIAYRGAFYDGSSALFPEGAGLGDYRLTQSLILRLGMAASTIAVTALPIKLSFAIWGAWKISNVSNGINDDYMFGPSFSVEY
jgi:hypothetical protein